AAASRSASQSGTTLAAASRFWRSHHRDWSCQCARASSATKRAASSGWPLGDSLIQDLRHVHDAQRLARAPQQPIAGPEAGHIGPGDDLGAGALVIGDAILAHHAAQRLLGDGERPAEAAALVGPRRVHELDVAQPREQLAHLAEAGHAPLAAAAEAQLAQAVTAVVEPDLVGEPAVDLEAHHVDEELAHLVGGLLQAGL